MGKRGRRTNREIEGVPACAPRSDLARAEARAQSLRTRDLRRSLRARAAEERSVRVTNLRRRDAIRILNARRRRLGFDTVVQEPEI